MTKCTVGEEKMLIGVTVIVLLCNLNQLQSSQKICWSMLNYTVQLKMLLVINRLCFWPWLLSILSTAQLQNILLAINCVIFNWVTWQHTVLSFGCSLFLLLHVNQNFWTFPISRRVVCTCMWEFMFSIHFCCNIFVSAVCLQLQNQHVFSLKWTWWRLQPAP